MGTEVRCTMTARSDRPPSLWSGLALSAATVVLCLLAGNLGVAKGHLTSFAEYDTTRYSTPAWENSATS